jgi:hypothetical protein
MKVIIERERKVVRAEAGSVINAGWIGYKFALDHRDLAEQGWVIICYRKNDADFGPDVDDPERFDMEADWLTAADRIAGRIRCRCCHDCCCRRDE